MFSKKGQTTYEVPNKNGYLDYFLVQSIRGVKLIPCLHMTPSIKTNGAIPSIPHCMPSWGKQGKMLRYICFILLVVPKRFVVLCNSRLYYLQFQKRLTAL